MRNGRHLQQDVADRQVEMFAAYVGDHRHIAWAKLANRSGIPESTLKSYARPEPAVMPAHVLLAIAAHLPREAINEITEAVGLRFVSADPTEANFGAIAVEATGFSHEYLMASSDGHLCHVDKAKLRKRKRVLQSMLDMVEDD